MGFLSGVGNLLGLGNPAKSARKYLEPIEGYGHTAYDPYIAQGREVDPMLRSRYDTYLGQEPMGAYQEMANDPTGLINAIMAQYAQSPAAAYKQKQLTQQAQNAARAGGYAGTMGDQRQQAELVEALTSMDMQQWLENALGIKSAGLQGQQYLADKGLSGLEGISDRGFASSSALADYLGSAAAQRAGLEFGGKQAQNANISGLLSALMTAGVSAAGGAAGAKMGGGMGGGMMQGRMAGAPQASQNYITAPGRAGAPGSFRWYR